ncbi:hypothetical protein [Oricola sp.]|uniref:hypothetical protein n=1 Tax=Oricola sp. TaxID=1979950 RepID=UPI003BACFE51
MALLHLSINAADPEGISAFLATILGGEHLPFPPFPGCWIAFAQADDGTAIEVYPLTHRLVPGPETIECSVGAPDGLPTFAHAAIASPLPREAIVRLGQERGWTTQICSRGPFHCIEIWLENRLLVEVLDPAMLSEYRAGMTAANWKNMFGIS